MQSCHFERLIHKHSVPFILLRPGEGSYQAGDWVEGELQETQTRGAILPLSARRIYQSGGLLTSLDRQLVALAPLGERLEGVKARHLGVTYTVEPDTDYSGLAGFWTYVLKAVER